MRFSYITGHSSAATVGVGVGTAPFVTETHVDAVGEGRAAASGAADGSARATARLVGTAGLAETDAEAARRGGIGVYERGES